jgi:cytochrome P450
VILGGHGRCPHRRHGLARGTIAAIGEQTNAVTSTGSAPHTRGRSDALPPGPPLPELAQLASWLYRPSPFLSCCSERYGPTFTLRFFPETWPEPRRFDPSRFLGPEAPSPYAYLPFGGGARRCIGLAFAHYEMRIVLATVLARFHVHRVRGVTTLPERRGVTIAPSGGMPVILERR